MNKQEILNILIIEEDRVAAENLRRLLKAADGTLEWRIEISIKNSLDQVVTDAQYTGPIPQLVILCAPGERKEQFISGISQHIRDLRHRLAGTEVIIVYSPDRVETVIAIFSSGAYDFIFRDHHTNRNLLHSIQRYLQHRVPCPAVPVSDPGPGYRSAKQIEGGESFF